MSNQFSDQDREMMRRCFRLARKGQARVHPNPMVGAVIVKNGRIIGEGYHHYFGGPHAEVEAFRNAQEDVSGATLYCNLEPCCHSNKKTPPCTPLIISKKIKRVVVSNLDPNPEVNGKGLQQLRQAGIVVQAGLLREEGQELNRFFFVNMQEQRPYITVKVAQSIDGYISAERGRQTWLSAKQAVAYVHRLRSFHDAVLVGAGTITSDDPQLTVRQARGPNPKRIVLSPNLRLPLNAAVFNDAHRQSTIVLTSELAGKEKVEKLKEQGIIVRLFPGTSEGKLELHHVLKVLRQEYGIGSVLVEGGQKIFSAFLREERWDEWIVLQTPKILGRGIPVFSDVPAQTFALKGLRKLGEDVALIYRRKEK